MTRDTRTRQVIEFLAGFLSPSLNITPPGDALRRVALIRSD